LISTLSRWEGFYDPGFGNPRSASSGWGAFVNRLRLFLIALVLGVGLAILLPAGLWIGSGQGAWLLLVPVLFLVLLFVVIQVGLWGSRGNLVAFLRGQFEPEPRRLQRDASVKGGCGQAEYAARVALDLERPVAEVAAQYLSFAVDTSQAVGGKWWDPGAEAVEWSSGTLRAPVLNFSRPRLDLLAGALAPAYLRIGGSEADRVYYDLRAGADTPAAIPEGYESVLTRGQWDAIHAFAVRNGLDVVCTLNAGPGARDRAGCWTGENATELLTYTAARGFGVAVWELGNEVSTFYAVHGPAAQVTVEQYARDLKVARRLVDRYTPGARLAGQGSAFWPVLGEPLGLLFGYLPGYLERAGDVVDLVSWHYYPQQSRRGPLASRRAYPSRLLDPDNLDEAAYWADRVTAWRNRYAPGAPVWMGETGNAQYGGEPGLSDAYLGGLWWLDQLGLLARHGHQVVIRQSLTGMNYGLLDEDTLDPRPDYWNSLLWKRLMGRRVYAARAEGEEADRLRVYAHAAVGVEVGSVAVLAVNLDPQRDAVLSFPDLAGRACEVYAVTAPDILGRTVLLNGTQLTLVDGRALPEIRGAWREGAGVPAVRIHPLSYAFVVFPPV
jgi:heparanase 1